MDQEKKLGSKSPISSKLSSINDKRTEPTDSKFSRHSNTTAKDNHSRGANDIKDNSSKRSNTTTKDNHSRGTNKIKDNNSKHSNTTTKDNHSRGTNNITDNGSKHSKTRKDDLSRHTKSTHDEIFSKKSNVISNNSHSKGLANTNEDKNSRFSKENNADQEEKNQALRDDLTEDEIGDLGRIFVGTIRYFKSLFDFKKIFKKNKSKRSKNNKRSKINDENICFCCFGICSKNSKTDEDNKTLNGDEENDEKNLKIRERVKFEWKKDGAAGWKANRVENFQS